MPPRSKQPDAPDGTATVAAELDPTSDDRPVGNPAEGNVILAVRHPHDSLTLGEDFDGLTLTSDGVEVPAEQEKAIRAAADEAGVRIRKVK